ncbi:MAG: CRISPR-associated endonuclease Cas2 [Bdellovibrionales bacterium]|nr:CRISPR-associated endonuclease Cas2 [Bdellovibrionales bacterium]
MLIVSYDITNDKLRTQFSSFLSKFGYRLQYSVFKIKNSDRVLNNITAEIKGVFSKKFSETDSVIVFSMSKQCKVYSYGYARNEEKDLILVS